MEPFTAAKHYTACANCGKTAWGRSLNTKCWISIPFSHSLKNVLLSFCLTSPGTNTLYVRLHPAVTTSQDQGFCTFHVFSTNCKATRHDGKRLAFLEVRAHRLRCARDFCYGTDWMNAVWLRTSMSTKRLNKLRDRSQPGYFILEKVFLLKIWLFLHIE